jgi:EAL domain-containing protein (putative c-di-GMP-specific phosphodiesterase class I)
MIYPSRFIPIAEESSLILAIGEWVLLQACMEARRWQDAGIEGASVAVNLSARQFRDKHIISIVRHVLQDTGLDPSRLELEITESSIMHDIDQASAVMAGLKRLGVSISIDDFGTGYSNLHYLRSFPVDKLKMDQSFVCEVETAESAARVARALILFAQNLKLKVVAEGVETPGQARFLQEHGCDEIQGFLISRAQPPETLREMFLLPVDRGWMRAGATCRKAG